MVETRIQRLLEFIPDGCVGYLTAPPDMFYYSGFTGEGCLILSKNLRVILTDGRYTEQAQRQAPGFQIVKTTNHGGFLKQLGKRVFFQGDHGVYSQIKKLEDAGLELIPFSVDFPSLRSVKDEEELKRLQKAAEIGERAYCEVLNFIKPGRTEREIAAFLDYTMVTNGAQKTSFDTISISGANTSLPHGIPSDKQVQPGEFITMDFGCIYEGYCSDMTRTVAIGHVTEEMEKVYEIVKQAGDEAEKMLKSGVHCADGDARARELIQQAGFGAYFVHSTGHGVGIEIHESPNLTPKSCSVLQPGNVVTVEPGIYLPGKFGVRIENTVVIEQNCARPLQRTKKDLIIL